MHPPTFAQTMLFSSVLLLLLVDEGEGMPRPIGDVAPSYHQDTSKNETTKKTNEEIDLCETDYDRLELCQRCAKVTNSRNAYPFCCTKNDKEKTFQWCNDFLSFGLPPDNFVG